LTPLPAALGGTGLVAWRLETTKHFATWQTALGAFPVGGRWSSAGRRVIYTSLDPSTAIVEAGVHKGFDTLDTVPHTLLEIEIADPARVHVVDSATVPNPHWLHPGAVSSGQQAFGDALLAVHPLVVLPSVVSSCSWNLLIDVAAAVGLFNLRRSERFSMDPRLNPVGVPRARPPTV
jgi:RES domain-containing protein